jgi:hypothetical protein
MLATLTYFWKRTGGFGWRRPCYQACYYDALVGNSSVGVSPIGAGQLEALWASAFMPVEKGGCPVVT